VPVLDPLEISEMKISDAGTRQAGLSLVMKNAKVYGVKDIWMEKAE
jgi:CO dehydrogenase/acetyl-CoA synthase beta subunit